jgi:rhodanese-related sulfurtransferase
MNLINAQDLKILIEKNDVLMIDVRETSEYHSEHIESAILMPLSTFNKNNLPQTNKKIVIYCKSGRRGGIACEKIKSDENIFNLDGGIVSWKEAGYETKIGKSKCMPLDQQVHTLIGTSVLSFSVLAYFVNINFIFVPMFFGAGLTFAGLTRFCGLAMLLARAPWNKCNLSNSTSCNVK